MIQWITGIGAAISIKLSSSIDDVVWLAPFLTDNSTAKLTNSAIYIAVCLTQTIVAMAIAYSGDTLVQKLTADNPNAWCSEKILTVGAGALLALYSIKLFHEYFTEGGDDEGTELSSCENNYNKVSMESGDEEAQKPLSTKLPDSTFEEEGETKTELSDNEKGEKDRTQTLFVIAFLGSVDDLTLFVPMLVGKGFDMVQLVIGGFVAASIIVVLCVFIGKCKPVADCLSAIPLAAIVVTFASCLLVKGFLFTDCHKVLESEHPASNSSFPLL